MAAHFPPAYRWFVDKGLRDWEPWYFCDTPDSLKLAPDFARDAFARRAFLAETGAGFDVYLFARRQDMDTFAFFIVDNGVIQDRVVTLHLSFSGRAELAAPPRAADVTQTFIGWIRERCLPDVAEWIEDSA